MLTQSISLPGFVPTMQPTLVADAPEGDQWLHEIKYDGYRTELLLNVPESRAFTRNGHDWTEKYRLILDAARQLPGAPALLDGEIIVQSETGASDFHAVRSAITSAPARLVFYAFDLLMIDGRDIRREPCIDRRRRLREMIGDHDPEFRIQFSDHIVGHGPEFFHRAEAMGLEGIVSKLADSRYRSGYVTSWVKTKAFTEDHFVIVGTEQGAGPTTALCARETPHGLEYAGGAMLTLTAKERDRFWVAAEQLQRSTPPLKTEKRKAARWLEPILQARVRHLRGEEKLRHATVLELL
jgi:bifunctional non-homologous end joining protein LigD